MRAFKILDIMLSLTFFSISTYSKDIRLVGEVPATYYNKVWEHSQITKINIFINESNECYWAGGPGALELTIRAYTNAFNSEGIEKTIKALDLAFKWGEMAKTNKLSCRKSLVENLSKNNKKAPYLADAESKIFQLQKEIDYLKSLPPSEQVVKKMEFCLKKIEDMHDNVLKEGKRLDEEITRRKLLGYIDCFDFMSANDGQNWCVVIKLTRYENLNPDIKESIILTVKPEDIKLFQNLLKVLPDECLKLQQDIKSKNLLQY